ncbi:hypothetical protein GCM10009610_52390 [Pseudonocardia xinjiangensis]
MSVATVFVAICLVAVCLVAVLVFAMVALSPLVVGAGYVRGARLRSGSRAATV